MSIPSTILFSCPRVLEIPIIRQATDRGVETDLQTYPRFVMLLVVSSSLATFQGSDC